MGTTIAYLGYNLSETAYRWEEVAELHRWEVIDGWDDVDDTLRITFLQDGVPDPDVIAIDVDGVDGRTFGPYDAETIDGVSGLGEVTVFGRADRQFEVTLLENLGEARSMAALLLGQPPFSDWAAPAAIQRKVNILLESARGLGDINRTLARYGLTASPLRTGVDRKAIVQTLYPVENSTGLTPLRRHIEAELVAQGTSYKVADHFNRPGAYAQRPIVAGYTAPATGLVEIVVDPPHANPHAGDRLVLDIQQTSEEPAGFMINAERWKLQNTAAVASITLTHGDPTIQPSWLVDFTPYADSGLPVFSGDSETWRVTKVTHKGEGAAFETQLDLALWQGLPGRGADND